MADPAAAETDVAIIGAGPVGLFAVFECGMLGLRCHVLDSLEAIGGQCVALYPEKPIYDIPSQPAIGAAELIERLAAQAAPFGPVYHLGQQVTGLAAEPDGRWRLTTARSTVLLARAVIIAAGTGAFGPKRPPLAGLEAYEASGAVRYLVARREEFRGRRIVIAGGGDSATDWAVSLAEIAARIFVVHRRARFRAAPEMVARLEALVGAGRVEIVAPYQLARLEGEAGRLTRVVVADLDGAERALEADLLLPFFGLSMELGPIADWGLDLAFGQVRIDPARAETSIPGIYAIGDITTYPGKLKLILTGFAEAASAAHAIRDRLHPDQPLHWEYSTTRGVPGGGPSPA